MGKTYIKEENGQKVLYEENSFFADTKLGELHENLDGSLETRNFFGENFRFTEDKDELGEILTCIIPGTLPNDYKVETSGGESGTLKWNSWKERHELEEDPTKNSRRSSDNRSYYEGTSSGGGYSGDRSSKSKGRGGFGVRLLLGAISLGAGVLFAEYTENPNRNLQQISFDIANKVGVLIAKYTENPNRYNPSSNQADIILYPRTQHHHSTSRIRKASLEARIFNLKDGHQIRASLGTDLNYNEYLFLAYWSKLSLTTSPGFTSKLDDLYTLKLGETLKLQINNKDYKYYIEKIRDRYYFSLITEKSEWIKNGQPMGNLVKFSIEGLFRKRAEGIANNQRLFSKLLRTTQAYDSINKDYYIGREPAPGAGYSELTIWNKDVIDNRDSRNYWDLKPVAVTYLGPQKPGSTSTPFSLEGRFYQAVFDIEKRGWHFEELKATLDDFTPEQKSVITL